MPTTDRSYRALLRVPTLGRVLLSMQIARVAQSMVGVALVLFTLDRYGSPAFAGFVTFASVFPGLLISPVAGALLDRHGRIRLVLLDYLVALAAMALVGVVLIQRAENWSAPLDETILKRAQDAGINNTCPGKLEPASSERMAVSRMPLVSRVRLRVWFTLRSISCSIGMAL